MSPIAFPPISPRPDSPNIGWRNLSFRGYADYMATAGFATGLRELIEQATSAPTAIACTEAVPWRCHRSLIADPLTIRGIAVRHLMRSEEPTSELQSLMRISYAVFCLKK